MSRNGWSCGTDGWRQSCMVQYATNLTRCGESWPGARRSEAHIAKHGVRAAEVEEVVNIDYQNPVGAPGGALRPHRHREGVGEGDCCRKRRTGCYRTDDDLRCTACRWRCSTAYVRSPRSAMSPRRPSSFAGSTAASLRMAATLATAWSPSRGSGGADWPGTTRGVLTGSAGAEGDSGPIAHPLLVRARAVRERDIQRLADDWAGSRAARTVRRDYAVIRAIFTYAVDSDRLVRSPCRRIKLPPIPPGNRLQLTREDVEAIANAVGVRYAPMVWCGAALGLRWGEVVGLRVGRPRPAQGLPASV